MSELGFRVFLHRMFNDHSKTAEAIQASLGKAIAGLWIDPDAGDDGELVFSFEDDTRLHVYDAGRSCCETRYLTCDDDLDSFVGAALVGLEEREGPGLPYEFGVHETEFLIVTTSKGQFTVVTHNEHNGYYGGFALAARREGVLHA